MATSPTPLPQRSGPRRLNKAEIVGLQVADREWQAAGQQYQQAEAARAEIYRDLGLDPAKLYRLEADGSLHEPEANSDGTGA